MGQTTFQIRSSHGTIVSNKETGDVIHIEHGESHELEGITKVDVEEWKAYHGQKDVDDSIDILDLGLWINGKLEPPEYSWRSMMLRDNEDRISEAVKEAQLAFWKVIAEKYPEIKTGDYAPDATFKFDAQCEEAVRIWIESNDPNENAGK